MATQEEILRYIAKVAKEHINELEDKISSLYRFIKTIEPTSAEEIKNDAFNKLLNIERIFGGVEAEETLILLFEEKKEAMRIRNWKDKIEDFYIDRLYPLAREIFVGSRGHISYH